MGVESKCHLKAGVANHHSCTLGRRWHDTLSSNSCECDTEKEGAPMMPLWKMLGQAHEQVPPFLLLREKTINSNALKAPSTKWARRIYHPHPPGRAVLIMRFPVLCFHSHCSFVLECLRPSSMLLFPQGFPWGFSRASLIMLPMVIIIIIVHNTHNS